MLDQPPHQLVIRSIRRTAAILRDPHIPEEHVLAIADPNSVVVAGVQTMITAMASNDTPLPFPVLALIVQAIDDYARLLLGQLDYSVVDADAQCTRVATMLLRAASCPAMHALRHHGDAGKDFAEHLLQDPNGTIAAMVEINEQTEGLAPDQYETLVAAYASVQQILRTLGAPHNVVAEALPVPPAP